jgi:hypothetical protein
LSAWLPTPNLEDPTAFFYPKINISEEEYILNGMKFIRYNIFLEK